MSGDDIRSRYEQYAKLLGAELHMTINHPARSGIPVHGYLPVSGGYFTASDFSVLGIPCEELSLRYGTGTAPDVPLHYGYLVGVGEALSDFTGTVIAVVRRDSGLSHTPSTVLGSFDRLILAPGDTEYYEPQLRQTTAFAERKYHSRLFCRYEKSCGAVVYTVRDGEPLYLLIRNRSGHIGFPKGHVEFGEDEVSTMKREIREETSLLVEPELSFREEYRYTLWNVVHKTAVYSLAYFRDGETVTTMENEIFGDWIVPVSEARRLLSYDNDREILEKAHLYLKNTGRITVS